MPVVTMTVSARTTASAVVDLDRFPASALTFRTGDFSKSVAPAARRRGRQRDTRAIRIDGKAVAHAQSRDGRRDWWPILA